MPESTMSESIVDRYCAAVNSGDPHAIVALFAAGGQLHNPLGSFTTADELTDFYRDVVVAGQAQVVKDAVVSDGRLVMAEIVARSPLDPDPVNRAYAIDVFRLNDDGLIERLDIYYR